MNTIKAIKLQEQVARAQRKLEIKLNEVELLEQEITRLRTELAQAMQEPEQEIEIDLGKLYAIGGRL